MVLVIAMMSPSRICDATSAVRPFGMYYTVSALSARSIARIRSSIFADCRARYCSRFADAALASSDQVRSGSEPRVQENQNCAGPARHPPTGHHGRHDEGRSECVRKVELQHATRHGNRTDERDHPSVEEEHRKRTEPSTLP